MSRFLHVRYKKRGAVLFVLAKIGLGILITAQFVSKWHPGAKKNVFVGNKREWGIG